MAFDDFFEEMNIKAEIAAMIDRLQLADPTENSSEYMSDINRVTREYKKIDLKNSAEFPDDILKPLKTGVETISKFNTSESYQTDPSALISDLSKAKRAVRDFALRSKASNFDMDFLKSRHNAIDIHYAVFSNLINEGKKEFEEEFKKLEAQAESLKEAFKVGSAGELQSVFSTQEAHHRTKSICFAVASGILLTGFVALVLFLPVTDIYSVNEPDQVKELSEDWLLIWLIQRVPIYIVLITATGLVIRLFRSHYRLMLHAKFKQEVAKSLPYLLKSVHDSEKDKIWLTTLDVLFSSEDSGLFKNEGNDIPIETISHLFKKNS